MENNYSDPKYLYKIVSPEQWKETQLVGNFIISNMDSLFIHLATKEQLEKILKKFWNNKEHVILKLLVDKLDGDLVLENNPGGINKYYHLYEGNIPLNAIVEEISL